MKKMSGFMLMIVALLGMPLGSAFGEQVSTTTFKVGVSDGDDIIVLSDSELLVKTNTAWNRAVGSEASFKSYCLERSVKAYIGISGGDDVVAISNANKGVWVYSPDPMQLADKVCAQELGVGVVAGSTEVLQKYCQFNSMDNKVMYYGYADGKVIQSGDTKSLVWKDINMTPPVTARMSLPKEYAWGYVYLRFTDENGNLRYTYLGYGSDFYFPSAFAGVKGARLIIRGYTPDGYNIDQVVDLGSGDFLPVDEFKENFNSIVMEGFSYHTNEVVGVLNSENGVGKNPLFQVVVTGSISVKVSVQTSEGETPTGFYYRQIGGEGKWGEWQRRDVVDPAKAYIDLPAGTYHFDLRWENFHSESWKDMQWWNGYNEG